MHSVMTYLLALAVAPGPGDESPRDRYEALAREFEAATEAAYKANAGDEQPDRAPNPPRPWDFAPRFFALAEEFPDDPAAIDSLTWIASRCLYNVEGEKALTILARDYSRSDGLKDYCEETSRYGEPYWPYEKLLRAVLEDTPHREVRARACLALADHLKMAKESTKSRMTLVAIQAEWNCQPASLANFDRVKDRGLDKVGEESAALFKEVISKYADINSKTNFPSNAAEYAKGQLFEMRNLSIGALAPEIDGKDTFGKPMKLSDYRGKVVVLDFGSHRSCGVCRELYPALRQLATRLEGKPAALLGISVDDDVNELKELSRKGEITWPMWWDGEQLEGPIASQWVIRTMPTFYILDRAGVIRYKGSLQADQIDRAVDALLKETDAAKP